MARPLADRKFARLVSRDGRAMDVPLKDRGSLVRDDNIAIMGFPAGSSTADGASLTAQTLVIDEAGTLAHFITAPRSRVAIYDMQVNAIPLSTGYCPASIWGPASNVNPYIGVHVDQTAKVKFSLKNENGAAVVPYSAMQVAPKGATSSPPRIIALGQSSTITALGTSSTATVTFTIERPCVLDRLVIDFGGSGVTADDLYVSALRYNGDSLLSGAATPIETFSAENRYNPSLGIAVQPGMSLTLSIVNTDGTNAGEAWCGFTCL